MRSQRTLDLCREFRGFTGFWPKSHASSLSSSKNGFIASLFVLITGCSQLIPLSCHADDRVPTNSLALTEFLKRFDPLEQRGFVRTLRPGSTGIGFTLETLLKIKENNSPRGDLLGMEIKAYRDDEKQFDDHGKMNLFLKEPTWTDDRKTADRIRDYGYVDPNGRQAWYQSVTNKANDRGLRLRIDRSSQRLNLMRQERVIGYWTFDVLQRRLQEKLSEAVFVAAETRGSGKDEEFHYQTVTYCARPSGEKLLKLVDSGDVIVELRMHVKPTGGARNHGTAFRIRKHRLVDLYDVHVRCRPVPGKI